MSRARFPKPVAEVISTLTELFRHDGRVEIVRLLENAKGRLEWTAHDNYDGGTNTWALRLEVPVPLFAALGARLETIEKEICAKLSSIPQTYGEMRRSLVKCFAAANSEAKARALAQVIIEIPDLTGDEISVLQRACVENDQVAKAAGVPEAIYKAFGRPSEPKTTEAEDEVPF